MIKVNNGQNLQIIKYTGKDTSNNDVVDADVKFVNVNGERLWAKPTTITISQGAGTAISVQVLSSKEPEMQKRIDAAGGALTVHNGDTVYYDDRLVIIILKSNGYENMITSVTGVVYSGTPYGMFYANVRVFPNIVASATRITWGLELHTPTQYDCEYANDSEDGTGQPSHVLQFSRLTYQIYNSDTGVLGSEVVIGYNTIITLTLDYAEVITLRSSGSIANSGQSMLRVSNYASSSDFLDQTYCPISYEEDIGYSTNERYKIRYARLLSVSSQNSWNRYVKEFEVPAGTISALEYNISDSKYNQRLIAHKNAANNYAIITEVINDSTNYSTYFTSGYDTTSNSLFRCNKQPSFGGSYVRLTLYFRFGLRWVTSV